MKKFDLGVTAQYLIAKKFDLEVNSALLNKVNSSIDLENVEGLKKVIDNIFNSTTIVPVQCTSLSSNYSSVPYQFIAEDGRTISIRCNKDQDKIAVRYLGQPGNKIINKVFSEIYGGLLNNSYDYKKLFMNHTCEILPMFVEAFLDADIIIWIHKDKEEFKYHFIDGSSDVNMDFTPEHITNTQTLETWNNSNVIKYDNVSLANIQVFKDDNSRTWIFRFYAQTLIKYLEKINSNNETLGATAERTICDKFNLSWKKEDNLDSRYDVNLAYMISDAIDFTFSGPNGIPYPIEYVGSKKGERAGASKCSYDFLLKGNKTLSLKTNSNGAKVCPPEVGQPSAKTCYLYFGQFTEEDHIDQTIFKQMVFKHITDMLPIYIKYLFDSDYLLRIYVSARQSIQYEPEVYKKGYGSKFKWDKKLISFTKNTVEEWKESNTLKYDGITLGEFQVHNNRNSYKFRFDFDGLKKIINKKKLIVE